MTRSDMAAQQLQHRISQRSGAGLFMTWLCLFSSMSWLFQPIELPVPLHQRYQLFTHIYLPTLSTCGFFVLIYFDIVLE